MTNTDPGYIPKDLQGPGYTVDKGIIRAAEAAKEQPEAALKYWTKEYDWAIGLCKDFFPVVYTRCDNQGFNFYLIAENGKRGREKRAKEWALEGHFYQGITVKKLSFNAFSQGFAKSLLLTAFKAAERAWSIKSPEEEGLRFLHR